MRERVCEREREIEKEREREIEKERERERERKTERKRGREGKSKGSIIRGISDRVLRRFHVWEIFFDINLFVHQKSFRPHQTLVFQLHNIHLKFSTW